MSSSEEDGSMEVDGNDDVEPFSSQASSGEISVDRKTAIRTKAEELLETSNEYSAGNYTIMVGNFIKNDLNVKVKNPNDALFTLNILDMTSESAIKKHVHKQQGSITEELLDFLVADGITMGSWCSGEMEGLKKLCKFVPHPFNYKAILTKTNGMPEVVPTQKKPRVIRKLAQTEATKPKKIETPETDNRIHEENMKTAIKVLLNRCEKGNWYPYFKFVINPTSYTETVYNIFIVSFLINERYARLCSNDSEIYIAPMRTNINDKKVRRNSILKRKKSDGVTRFNSRDWKKLIKILHITKAQLPNMQPKVDENFDESDILNLRLSQTIKFID